MRIPAAIVTMVAAAGVAWGDAPDAARQAELRQAEARALLPLMRSAIREDHRRQAWYLAWRIAAAAPGQDEATQVLARWENERWMGITPSKAFVATRDATLRALGDAWAQEARVLRAQGAKAVDTFFALDRALAYGSSAADATAALDAAGYAWAGTWGAQAKEALQAAVGSVGGPVTFPPEWDSAVLAARAVGWTDAHVLSVSGRRIVVPGDLAAAGRRARLLTAMEAFFMAKMGTTWKEPKWEREEQDFASFFVCPDSDVYLRLFDAFTASGLLTDVGKQDLLRSSGSSEWATWPAWWPERAVLMEKPRGAPWADPDANFASYVAQSLAHRHLATGVWRPTGRGYWVLEALGGLFEGFRATGPADGAIDPDRIRHLAVARGLKTKGALLPWDKLLDADREAQRNLARQEVNIRFGGEDLVAKDVDVVAAQGTALLWAIWSAPDGKGPKRVATLVAETLKRDRMPDLDGFLALPKGRAEKDADAVLSASAK